jgi:hypothetical protein
LACFIPIEQKMNNKNTENELYGCQNDVIKFRDILINNYGYKSDKITMLIEKDGFELPTAGNIIKHLNTIVSLSNQNLTKDIVLYYSGHGTRVIDKNGDEPDRYDECIVPIDFATSGIITDDTIYTYLSNIKINTGNKMICVFDSCNSASCSDLPLSYNCVGNRIVKSIQSRRPNLNKQIYFISGCADNNYSYDVAEPDGTPCGLLSYSLRKSLEQNKYNCSIQTLLLSMTRVIKTAKLHQVPVISCGLNNSVPNTNVFSILKKSNASKINKSIVQRNRQIALRKRQIAQQNKQIVKNNKQIVKNNKRAIGDDINNIIDTIDNVIRKIIDFIKKIEFDA